MSETTTEERPAPEITIVVPIQRRDAKVLEVIEALGGELDRLGRTWEAILVFDGLKGPLWEAGLALQESSRNQVRTIALHRPFGESVCLSSAFEHAHGSIILTSPQYVQNDPQSVEPLLAALDNGADLAAGRRVGRVDSRINRMQSGAFNWVLRVLTGARFHDLNCTLRAIRRDVLEQLSIYGNMYRYLPIIAFKQGFRVDEVDVRHLQEVGGAGIYGPGTYARRLLDILVVVFLTRFTHKPLRFFGALGGMCTLFGMLLAGGVVVQRIVDPDMSLFGSPFFLLGVLFILLGVQIVGFGLVGEIIIFTQARNVREYRIERLYE